MNRPSKAAAMRTRPRTGDLLLVRTARRLPPGSSPAAPSRLRRIGPRSIAVGPSAPPHAASPPLPRNDRERRRNLPRTGRNLPIARGAFSQPRGQDLRVLGVNTRGACRRRTPGVAFLACRTEVNSPVSGEDCAFRGLRRRVTVLASSKPGTDDRKSLGHVSRAGHSASKTPAEGQDAWPKVKSVTASSQRLHASRYDGAMVMCSTCRLPMPACRLIALGLRKCGSCGKHDAHELKQAGL